MNIGNVVGIGILIGGFIFAWKYAKKRTEKEVKTIDNISHPKYDRKRNTTSTRSDKTSRAGKSTGIKNKIKTRRGIQIPDDSSRTRGKSIERKNSNSIELHKPTAL